jgi:radical SAM protein with 4Fe4S-binding SPASM domain
MNDHLTLSREEYEHVVERLRAHQKAYRNRLKIDMTPFSLSRYDETLKRGSSFDYYQRKNSCLISWVLSVITKDGDILPGCVEEASSHMAGNIFQDHFKDVWWSETLQEFRKKQLFKNLDHCSPTDCLGWCQHLITNRKLNKIRKLRFFSKS